MKYMVKLTKTLEKFFRVKRGRRVRLEGGV